MVSSAAPTSEKPGNHVDYTLEIGSIAIPGYHVPAVRHRDAFYAKLHAKKAAAAEE